jgi:hypothetical protein
MDTDIYLDCLYSQFKLRSGTVIHSELKSVSDVKSIFRNCTNPCLNPFQILVRKNLFLGYIWGSWDSLILIVVLKEHQIIACAIVNCLGIPFTHFIRFLFCFCFCFFFSANTPICTGLGAREVFGDTTLVPVRGQTIVIEPIPNVDTISFIAGLGKCDGEQENGVLK